MDLIVIAQLITGIATLIVASVLIWQMFIQKKTLDIAHNDNDANMSLSAMESRSAQSRWFAENSNQDMLQKMSRFGDLKIQYHIKVLSILYQTYVQLFHL